MLKEYLTENLIRVRDELTDLKKQYKKLENASDEMKERISDLHRSSNMDYEIFSPRMGDQSLRSRAAACYKEWNELQEQIRNVKQEMDRTSAELEKFKVMAAEFLALEKAANVSRETSDQKQKQM